MATIEGNITITVSKEQWHELVLAIDDRIKWATNYYGDGVVGEDWANAMSILRKLVTDAGMRSTVTEAECTNTTDRTDRS